MARPPSGVLPQEKMCLQKTQIPFPLPKNRRLGEPHRRQAGVAELRGVSKGPPHDPQKRLRAGLTVPQVGQVGGSSGAMAPNGKGKVNLRPRIA